MPLSHREEPFVATAARAERPVPTGVHVRRALRQGLAGHFPSRYRNSWRGSFDARFAALHRPGQRVLDVGSGALPTIAPADRAEGCTYVGLDLSADELARAPEGSYDETVVGDVSQPLPELAGTFDLAVSWMVLEHVADVEGALRNLHSYLRPGGHLLAQFPGRHSLFGRLNRAVPAGVAPFVVRHVVRSSHRVFRPYYDRCHRSGMAEVLDGTWDDWEVEPIFAGAFYFAFARPLFAAALAWEEWAYRTGRDDLASYYCVQARA